MFTQNKISSLERMASKVFNIRFLMIYFLIFNIIFVSWVLMQNILTHPFDAYPYPMLNLMLAWFVAAMDIVMLMASVLGSRPAERQSVYMLELMESQLAILKTIKEMQENEEKWEIRMLDIVQGLKNG